MGLLFREHPKAQPEGGFILFYFFFSWARPVLYEVVFVGLFFREHPKAQPEGGFRRSPGSNLRPLVYKASDLTTAPRRLLVSLL